MNPNQSKQTILAIAVIILGFVAVFGLSSFLEKNRPALPAGFEDEDVAVQGANLKGYALGFEGLIADWYWMKSLQYLGGKIVNSKENLSLDNLNSLNPRLLYPYLNNATDLDPKFISVYEYGAMVLPAIDKEKAIELTQKGIDSNPDNWRLYHYLGYIHWQLKDYEKAAEVYRQGSQISDAPNFMKSMAAKMKSEGGNRETARIIYRQMFDEAQDEQVRENANIRLLQLDSLDERDIIQKVLNDFKLKNNRCPNNWREILPLMKNEKLTDGRDFRIDNSGNLVDPSGASYLLKNTDGNCDVSLDFSKTKIPAN